MLYSSINAKTYTALQSYTYNQLMNLFELQASVNVITTNTFSAFKKLYTSISIGSSTSFSIAYRLKKIGSVTIANSVSVSSSCLKNTALLAFINVAASLSSTVNVKRYLGTTIPVSVGVNSLLFCKLYKNVSISTTSNVAGYCFVRLPSGSSHLDVHTSALFNPIVNRNIIVEEYEMSFYRYYNNELEILTKYDNTLNIYEKFISTLILNAIQDNQMNIFKEYNANIPI